MKKAQSYLTLFFAILVVFLLIIVQLLIAEVVSRKGIELEIDEEKELSSFFPIIFAPINLYFRHVDIDPATLKEVNIYFLKYYTATPVRMNLIEVLSLVLVENKDPGLLKIYCSRFELIFQDELCLEIDDKSICRNCDESFTKVSFYMNVNTENKKIVMGLKKKSIIDSYVLEYLKEVLE
ncbi:MAG: hypothetical protein QW524_03010 [Candidatus Woesearchaeota archaeon]